MNKLLLCVLGGMLVTMFFSGCSRLNVSSVTGSGGNTALEKVQKQGLDLSRLDAIATTALTDGTSLAPSPLNGLQAEYFSGTDPTVEARRLIKRTDTNINFKFRGASFDPTKFPNQKSNFSARWTGFIKTPDTGSTQPQTYVFIATHADGFRMYIDDLTTPSIASFTDHPTTALTAASVTLVPGKTYAFKAEFYAAGGPAEARLFWILPDGDFDLTKVAIVPSSAFFQPQDTAPTVDPPATPVACGSAVSDGAGLVADIFASDQNNPSAQPKDTCLGRRVDPFVNFWTGGGYAGQGFVDFNAPGLTALDALKSPNHYRIEWNGYLQSRYTEAYVLNSASVEQMKVLVDDKIVIDSSVVHGPFADGAAARGSVNLDATKRHKIQISMTQKGGAGVARLLWSSAHQKEEVIPGSQFSHGAVANVPATPPTDPTSPNNPPVDNTPPLAVNLTTATLNNSETKAFVVTGGKSAYTVTVTAQTADGKKGTVSGTNGNYSYTAPTLAAGAANHVDLVSISDAASLVSFTVSTVAPAATSTGQGFDTLRVAAAAGDANQQLRLLDTCGNPMQLRGVEQALTDLDNMGGANAQGWINLVSQIAATGANALRILIHPDVVGVNDLDAILTYIESQRMVVYISLYRPGLTRDYQWAYYARPDVKAVINKHRKSIIIDALQEVGDFGHDEAGRQGFFALAKQAIDYFRGLGYTLPIKIMPDQSGRDFVADLRFGPDLVAYDRQKNSAGYANLMMGVQAYWNDYYSNYYGYSVLNGYQVGGADKFLSLAEAPSVIRDFKMPIQLGLEYNSEGFILDGQTLATVLAAAKNNGVGFLWWHWAFQDPLTTDGTVNGLTAVGKALMNDPNGLHTAVKACAVGSGLGTPAASAIQASGLDSATAETLDSSSSKSFTIAGGTSTAYSVTVTAQTQDGKKGAVSGANGSYIYVAPTLATGSANHIDVVAVSDGKTTLTLSFTTMAPVTPTLPGTDPATVGADLAPLAANNSSYTDRDVMGVGYLAQVPCPTNKAKTCKATRYPAYSNHALMMWESYLLEGTIPGRTQKVYTGDYQVNKQIIAFSIKEFFDENDNLHHIELEYVPRATNTDEPWRLHLSLNGSLQGGSTNDTLKRSKELISGAATVTTRYLNRKTGVTQAVTDRDHDAVIIPDVFFHPIWDGGWERERLLNNGSGSYGNSYAPNYITKIRIDVANPAANPYASRSGRSGRSGIDLSRYRVYIDRGQSLAQSENNVGAIQDLKEVIGDSTKGVALTGGAIRTGDTRAAGAEVFNGQYGIIVPREEFQPIVANPQPLESGADLWEMPGFNLSGTLEFFDRPDLPYAYNIGANCGYCWGEAYYKYQVTGRDGIIYRMYPGLKDYFTYLMGDRTAPISAAAANWDMNPSSIASTKPAGGRGATIVEFVGDPRTWVDLRDTPAIWK